MKKAFILNLFPNWSDAAIMPQHDQARPPVMIQEVYGLAHKAKLSRACHYLVAGAGPGVNSF